MTEPSAYDLIRNTETRPFIPAYAVAVGCRVLGIIGTVQPPDRVRIAVEDALWADWRRMLL
jgi:hypothetical protein